MFPRKRATSKSPGPVAKKARKSSVVDKGVCKHPVADRKARKHSVAEENALKQAAIDCEQPEADLDCPASNANLKAQLELVASRAPRSLFRGWHTHSGGDPLLNNPEAITPHAFLSGRASTGIHDMSRQRLSTTADAHFGEAEVLSPFSSWSGSLPTAYHMASNSPDAHVSMLDTAKLPARVKALWTPALQILDAAQLGDPTEFLVYGVVAGETLHTVRIDALRAHALQDFLPDIHARGASAQPLDQAVHAALRLGALYGPPFALPFAAYALTLTHRSPDDLERLAALLLSSRTFPQTPPLQSNFLTA